MATSTDGSARSPSGATVQTRSPVGAEIPYSGARFLQITNGASGIAAARPSATVPVGGSETLAISFYAKNAAGGGQLDCFIETLDAAGASTFTLAFSTGAIPVTYTRFQGRVVTPASAVQVRIYFQNSIASSWVYLDDVAMTRYQDIVNASGNVVIDGTGITINNGKMVLQDEFGKTSMVASGFSGNWSDFLATGLYNGRFLSGTAGAIAAGRTSALPYWTLANSVGTPIATFVVNAGVDVTFSALNDKKSFTSDIISVHPAAIYQAAFTVSIVKGSRQSS
jgi:hypothetical protein